MEVTVNINELATKLAHRDLIEYWEGSVQIYKNVEAETLEYTEEAQDIFDGLYDKYYGIIELFEV